MIHSAFYRFTHVDDVAAVVARLRELTQALMGQVLVAAEGINGAVAGEREQVLAFEQALLDEPLFGGGLAGMPFKHSACVTPPFGRMKVHHKPEVVAVGVPPVDGPAGTTLTPLQWRDMLARGEAVVLDNRNSFEWRLGHFQSALDPQVQHFKDFPAFVEAHAAQWRTEGRPVAMYCTGGIRCERTSAWMQSLGLQVWQLEGGILNYFQALPDAERDWQGECFVFDNRIALNTRLQETATTLEQVYADEPDGAWRLARARRLQSSVA